MPRKACDKPWSKNCDPNGFECPGCSHADQVIIDEDWPKLRCRLTGEGECHGHDCIDRVGIPCVYDTLHTAGTEDIEGGE